MVKDHNDVNVVNVSFMTQREEGTGCATPLSCLLSNPPSHHITFEARTVPESIHGLLGSGDLKIVLGNFASRNQVQGLVIIGTG